MTRPSPAQQLREARQIAADNNLFVKDKELRPGLTHYYIYRKLPHGHLTFLGKRGSPEGCRAYVAKLAHSV